MVPEDARLMEDLGSSSSTTWTYLREDHRGWHGVERGMFVAQSRGQLPGAAASPSFGSHCGPASQNSVAHTGEDAGYQAAEAQFSPDCKAMRRAAKNARASPKAEVQWWKQLSDICPITNFPVNLLPYPPFKLQIEGLKPRSTVLVDGSYLILQVLSTWCFEVLDTPLNHAQVVALDAYVRRCKLGPFRIGRAMQLLEVGTAEAMGELLTLRERSTKRLDLIQHVQQARLGKVEESQVDAAPQQPVAAPRPPPRGLGRGEDRVRQRCPQHPEEQSQGPGYNQNEQFAG